MKKHKRSRTAISCSWQFVILFFSFSLGHSSRGGEGLSYEVTSSILSMRMPTPSPQDWPL